MNVTSDEVPVVKRRSPPGALLYFETDHDAHHSETDIVLCFAAEANTN